MTDLDPRDQFWAEQARCPRGYAPSWRGEDAPSELGWGDIYTDDDELDPYDELIVDPGFPEIEVDTHPDPDHYTDYDRALNDFEHQEAHEG